MVTLEAMGSPGYYVTFAPDLSIVLSQPDGSLDFCDAASFVLRPALSGVPGARSLEAAAKPGVCGAYVVPVPDCFHYTAVLPTLDGWAIDW